MTTTSTPGAAAAQPVTFDREGRHLFGWYHAPAMHDGLDRDCVVVMVPPVGYDAVCTHRHYRQLAMQLAQTGFAVLRYDHHGTGDSSGSEEDPQRIAAWTNGVVRATEFARRRSGAGKACLFGVRLGATLALSAARTPGLAQHIVAWAPFPSGKGFLREMRALGMRRDADPTVLTPDHDPGADVGEEAAGYVLTASTIAALGALDLLALDAPPAADILLLERDDLPQNDKLPRHLRQLGCEVAVSKAPGYAAMMRDPYESAVPRAALDQIGEWLSGRCPLQPSTAVPLPSGSAPVLAGPGNSVQELPLRFGRHGNLFGMLSLPREPQGDRGLTAVVFVSVGANLHTGPNRMYVTQARVLASLGFVALRMDIGGVGESPAQPGAADNHVYAPHSIADVQDALGWLRGHHGIVHTVLIGLCSGAYLTFHAALADAAVSSIVLINQQTFHWKEGDTLEVRSRRGIQSLGFYRTRLFRRDTWERMLRGEVHVRLIASGVARVLQRRIGHQWTALRSRPRPAGPAAAGNAAAPVDVPAAFKAFVQRGTEVFLVFSAEDGGLDEIETHLGPGARRLRGQPHFKLQIVDGADHTFTPLWSQRRLSDLLAQHVMRLYG